MTKGMLYAPQRPPVLLSRLGDQGQPMAWFPCNGDDTSEYILNWCVLFPIKSWCSVVLHPFNQQVSMLQGKGDAKEKNQVIAQLWLPNSFFFFLNPLQDNSSEQWPLEWGVTRQHTGCRKKLLALLFSFLSYPLKMPIWGYMFYKAHNTLEQY